MQPIAARAQFSRSSESVVRVSVQGAIASDQPRIDAERIVAEIDATATDNEVRVEVDLAQCHALRTDGVEFLLELRRLLIAEEVDWTILHAPPTLRRALDLLNLQENFSLQRSDHHVKVVASDPSPRALSTMHRDVILPLSEVLLDVPLSLGELDAMTFPDPDNPSDSET